MTNEILKDEILNEEQLNLVVGGIDQDEVDSDFFRKLGYNTARTYIGNAFADNGVFILQVYSYGPKILTKSVHQTATKRCRIGRL